MIRSNIKGLANLLNKFDRRINSIETKLSGATPVVKGGSNTNVTQIGNVYTINSKADGGGSITEGHYYPFKPYVKSETEGENTTYSLYCKGGMVNGVIPINTEEEIVELTDAKDLIIYIEGEYSNTLLTTLTFKASSTPPNLEYEFLKNAPPSKFRHLVGTTEGTKVGDHYLRTHLKIRPVIAFRDASDTGIYEDYWTWDITSI